MSLSGLFNPQDEILQEMFSIIDTSSVETLNSAIVSNQHLINQILVKLLVVHKYTLSNTNVATATNRELLASLTNTDEFLQANKDEDTIIDKDDTSLLSNNVDTGMQQPSSDAVSTTPLFDLISEESIQNIFEFLNEDDIYRIGEECKTLHVVSHLFNKLLQERVNNKQFSDLHLKFDDGYYYCVNEIYQALQRSLGNKGLECDFQMPNGLVVSGVLKTFSYPLDKDMDTLKRLNIVFASINITASSKLAYQNRKCFDLFNNSNNSNNNNNNSDSDITKDMDTMCSVFPLTNLTRTSFIKSNKLRLRRLVYNKDAFSSLDNLYGNNDFKLIDINLYGLYNYFIYDSRTYSLLSEYSIAHLAFYFSKRQWIVGIINIASMQRKPETLHNQIEFTIDITEEIEKFGKSDEFDRESRTKEIELHPQEAKLANVLNNTHHVLSGTTIGNTNLTRDTNDRYYIKIYSQLDNGRIVQPFGTFTNKEEQCKIWLTDFKDEPSFRDDNGSLAQLKKIVKFDFEHMYDNWYLHDEPFVMSLYSNHNQNRGKFKYLLIDCMFWEDWHCGILMYPDSTDYIQDASKLKDYCGLVGVEMFAGINVAYSAHSRRLYRKTHLDSSLVSYFGNKTSKAEQLNILTVMCNNKRYDQGISDAFKKQIQRLNDLKAKMQREEEEKLKEKEKQRELKQQKQQQEQQQKKQGKKSGGGFKKMFGKKKKQSSNN